MKIFMLTGLFWLLYFPLVVFPTIQDSAKVETKGPEHVQLTKAEAEKAELVKLRRENFTLRLQAISLSIRTESSNLDKQEAEFLEEISKAHGIDVKEYELNAQRTAFIKKPVKKENSK